ncbi:lipopolysaccharide transport periplasmic protein LptA [Dyella kyungheensis]|jgi:lipopolysaccharide export system protein LptA|uniref:Lipopolysaccharide transport periplasmic protein LptA n=1 Tax=Dyella kyungheensis TaxID=1242174 RepID=A0ABS2JV91_9GAMM|nr:lipopolysaccharide transport periplasmic protein LptA [Dyella kyungheensis]MBM7122494.1 lipopolysaccharide transport periplasmic protein LptA [Dyella kyungheensis]
MKSPARFRRDPRSLKLPLALLGLGLLILQPALAKQDDRNQPMNFSSKSMDGFNAPNTVTTLTGNVVATQGTMKLTGAVAKLYLDADTQVARAVVTGNLAHIEQLDDAGNLMQGDALQLDYDNINGIAVLTGNAVVRQQGRGEFHGDKLVYNTQTSLITGEAAGDGLVHGVILPKAKPGAPAATPPKPGTPPATPPPAPKPAEGH